MADSGIQNFFKKQKTMNSLHTPLSPVRPVHLLFGRDKTVYLALMGTAAAGSLLWAWGIASLALGKNKIEGE
jgi:hypothetical protein